jgi:proteasome lid subunit RPN8/RPN11
MTNKINGFKNNLIQNIENTENTNCNYIQEYQSPDTELKFLEELVKDDKINTSDSKTYKITKGAFNKAMTYAKAIGQLAGTGMECYGYLLKPVDSFDDIVTDIFLAPNQTNQAAYVRVSAEGVYQSSQEIEPRGLMMVGWWHSHGTFSTFHSGTDVRNFEIVLHSIAPRTMYKNEKGQYTYDKDNKELMLKGIKVKGLELKDDAQIEVIRKVEQDPYAYSMVVNMYRSCYLEKITKSFVSKEVGFKLNPPIRPALEIVTIDNDVKYTISEIEDDITSKVEIRNNKYNYDNYAINSNFNANSNWGFKKNNSIKTNGKQVAALSSATSEHLIAQTIIQPSNQQVMLNANSIKMTKNNKIISEFLQTLNDGVPDYLVGFIDGLQKQEKYVLSKLTDSSIVSSIPSLDSVKTPLAISPVSSNVDDLKASKESKKFNLEELSNILNTRFANTSDNYSLAKSYDIQRLREEMTWNFINKYANNSSIDTVKEFADANLKVSNNFNIAVNAGKALAKYSMERFTDYGNKCTYNYKNFMGHFLENMNTTNYVPIGTSFKMSENSRYDKATDKLFLYEDRLKIINNILTTLNFNSKESKITSFLIEFAGEYQKNPSSVNLDSIIEQKLLSAMGASDFNSYKDRTSYERKGIISKIFGEMKGYFGGI